MSEKLLEHLKGEHKRMSPDHDKRATLFLRCHKQFRGIIPEDKKTTKSRLFIQRTKVACLAGVANVMDILFPTDDFFDMVGRNDPDVKGAEISKKVMRWALRVGRWFRTAYAYVMQAAIYGTTFGKVVPYTISETVTDMLPQYYSEQIPTLTGVQPMSRKVMLKLAKLEVIDPLDVWVDPTAPFNIDNASGLFHKFRRSLPYLEARQKEGIYKNIGELKARMENRTGKDYVDTDYNKRRQDLGLPPLEFSTETIPLYEYSGKLPADVAKSAGIKVEKDEFEVECIVTTDTEFEVVLRAERNTNPGQMRMWISDVWEPAGDGSLWGRGIPENVRGSQQALNVTVNLRLDNKAWAIAAPLVVNIDKLEDPNKDLVAKVNWVIRGRGAAPSEIAQFAQIPDMTAGSIQEAQEFERHIDEESGMNKAVQATQDFGANRTFGGISLAYSAAARPIRLIAKGFEDNLVSQGLKRIFMLLLQYLEPEMKIRITDDPQAPEYMTLDPMSMATDIDFISSGSFALSQRDQVVQSMNAFFDSIGKIPQVAQMPNWNWKYIVQKYYEAIGLKDFDKVWLDQPPMAGMMPQGGQGGATAEGGPGGAGPGAPQGTNIIELLASLGQMAGGRKG